jgi:hypothetical protein
MKSDDGFAFAQIMKTLNGKGYNALLTIIDSNRDPEIRFGPQPFSALGSV